MPNVFISRKLTADSPLRAWCVARNIDILDQSLLSFQPVVFGPLPEAIDWIFFYSPRAVEFFLAGAASIPAGVQLAAIGPGTARCLEEQQLEVHFTGTGHPASTARNFSAIAAGKRVLFPQARQSRRTVAKLLTGQIEALEVTVYDNQMAPQAFDSTFDTLIFTSPLNVQAFLAANEIGEGSQIIAIGPSTAACLEAFKLIAEQPLAPTEAAIISLLD